MKAKQILIFKSSVRTKEKKTFLMQLLKLHLPQVQSATLDLDDEDAIFRVETEECSVDLLTALLHKHGIKVDFLDRFVLA
ncbi:MULTISPECIES: hypothetical protein [Sphingobacterium]|uniref:NIL domain-containing protein n=2 Tax=Sphingobacterium TaxID=28453 RepID=A0A420BIM5_SPHD1|nr:MULTISPECIES: hypothetical protein [Sphingobacterium]RKE56506.1 hypothetical protein DFQ12_1371 [Sphingobacterium detergens]ULT24313.1 hypothetical protein KUH03_35700 [Sphingobacterium sp. E70]